MKKVCILLISVLLVFACTVPGFATDAKSLFEFDYDGSHIQTFGTYSIVDGKVCYTHRYFLKDGNLVVIDQNLDPTPTGIFIHFEGGKSYIAVLCKSGKIVSLGTEDLCSSLQNFKNKDIKSLAETVSYDSKYLNLEYKDGSKCTYDCVTGQLYSQSGATAPKSAEEFFDGFISDFIDRSISSGVDTSGAKAQGVVNALNESGVSLDQLLDAGIVEGIEADYSGEIGEGEFSGEWSYEVWTGTEAQEPIGTDEPDVAPYDFSQDEDYLQLMESKEAELSTEEVNELRDLFAKISRGELSSDEAVNLISKETHKADNETKIDDSTIKEITSAIAAVEQSAKEYKEEHKSEKQFIEPMPSNKYLAVYNADEKRYDIYSEKNLLSNPEHLETEVQKISDIGKVENLNKLLSSDKNNDTRRGMNIFSTVALSIVLIVAIILIIGVANIKKSKMVKYE